MPLTEEIRTRHKARLSSVRYRLPLQIAKILVLTQGDSYPICPRCYCTLEREYMHFCDRCGQHLGWERFDFAQVIDAPRKRG